MKSEGVKDVVKWLEKRCKEQKKNVEYYEKRFEETNRWCQFEDEECVVEGARIDLEREKAKFEVLVQTKISVEKYMRKLRHQGE